MIAESRRRWSADTLHADSADSLGRKIPDQAEASTSGASSHQRTERRDDIDHALLIVILRPVSLLYAEERDLPPDSDTFARTISLALFRLSTTAPKRAGYACRRVTENSSTPTDSGSPEIGVGGLRRIRGARE